VSSANAAQISAAVFPRLPTYVFQMSRSEQRVPMHGARVPVWPEDMAGDQPFKYSWRTRDDVLCMDDVDHYVDIPGMLRRPTRCVFVSFWPDMAACDSGYQYFVDGGNKYHCSFGNNTYSHHVWDYKPGFMVKSWFGLWRTYYVASMFTVGRGKRCTVLQPVWSAPVFLCFGMHGVEELSVYKPVTPSGKFVRHVTNNSVSIAPVNGLSSVNVSRADHDAIVSYVAAVKSIITVGNVRNHFKDLKEFEVDVLFAYLVTEFANGASLPSLPLIRYSPSVLTQDMRSPLIAFCSPLDPNSVVPARCIDNDRWTIQARVYDPALNVDTHEFDDYVTEFVSCVHAIFGSLTPYSTDEVQLRMTTAQRKHVFLTGDAEGLPLDWKVAAFMKAESYQKFGPARNISTITPALMNEYFRYIYPIYDKMPVLPFYGFLGPCALQERVAKCAVGKASVAQTDFSKFDGSIGPVHRRLEAALLEALFDDPRILELWQMQIDCRGRTKTGVHYDTGTTRLSGSPETSCFNTFINAFIAYAAFRRADRSPSQAFRALGIYGGDDGLTFDPPLCYEVVAAATGLKLAVEVLPAGRPFKFLSRYYGPSTWVGDPNSCSDIRRQVAKLHLAPNSPQPPLTLLRRKLAGYKMTDRHTPIIGDLIARAERIQPRWLIGTTDTLSLSYYITMFADGTMFTSVREDWMVDLLGDFPYLAFLTWLDTVTTLEQLLCMPTLVDFTLVPVRPVDVDAPSISHVSVGVTTAVPDPARADAAGVNAGEVGGRAQGVHDVASEAAEPRPDASTVTSALVPRAQGAASNIARPVSIRRTLRPVVQGRAVV
jgi:hypothetical protein